MPPETEKIMAKRTKYLGFGRTSAASDKYLSPQNPQTGDGKTTRRPHDQVRVENIIVPPKKK